jgi:hypothetical protein
VGRSDYTSTNTVGGHTLNRPRSLGHPIPGSATSPAPSLVPPSPRCPITRSHDRNASGCFSGALCVSFVRPFYFLRSPSLLVLPCPDTFTPTITTRSSGVSYLVFFVPRPTFCCVPRRRSAAPCTSPTATPAPLRRQMVVTSCRL